MGFLCGKLIDLAMFQVEWENLGEQKPIFHNNHVLWEGKARLGAGDMAWQLGSESFPRVLLQQTSLNLHHQLGKCKNVLST